MADTDPPSPAASSEPFDEGPLDDAPPPAVARTHVPPAGDPLALLRWLAVLGVAALVIGRFVAPALPGALIGAGRTVRAFEVIGGALSQLFAIGSIVGMAIALLATASTNIPLWMRLLGLMGAAFSALLVVIGAAGLDRVAETPALFAAAGAGGFAILAALGSRGSRVTLLPAVALGLVGAATMTRALFGLAHLHGEKVLSPTTLLAAGKVAATVASLLVGLALALVLAYIGRSARPEAEPGAPPKTSLWSPLTLAVLVLAVLCARQAVVGAGPDAGLASVVLKRASDRFLVQPEPYFRAPVRLFLGFLTPLTAAALLLVRRVPTLTAALCLALVAADVTGAPLGAITLLLASLGVLLVARSGHVLWSALIAKPPSAPAAG